MCKYCFNTSPRIYYIPHIFVTISIFDLTNGYIIWLARLRIKMCNIENSLSIHCVIAKKREIFSRLRGDVRVEGNREDMYEEIDLKKKKKTQTVF